MKLGDVLAEQFRLKAQLIRINYGLAITCVWLLGAIIVFVFRVIFAVWVLMKLNAPTWVWAVWILHIPFAFLIEHLETKEKK